MTRSFILTPSASRDIDGILEYVLEQSGLSRALHVHQKLYDGLAKVATQPHLLGHVRGDLADEAVRVFAVFSYLIVYRPDTVPVQVVRVIHGARDVPTVLDEGP